MFLNGFSLEVLVDGRPLVEYNIPDSATNMTTGRSYVLQENEENEPRQTFSESNNHIVAESGRKFKVRFYSTRANMKNQIVAEALVDGLFDKTFRGLRSNAIQLKDCFYNSTRTKKLEFSFSDSVYDDSSGNPNSVSFDPRGGIGAISVYFYKGCPVPRRNVNLHPSFDIQQVKVKEDKKSLGIQCTTAFITRDIGQSHVCGYYDMVKASTDPIAVLHLHYRPASWFAVRGIQVQVPNLSFCSTQGNQRSNLSNGSKKDDDIEPDSTEIKNENDHDNKRQIKIEDSNRNNKRPFDEKDIIEEIDVIDLTSVDVRSAGNARSVEIAEKRARVINWLSTLR